MVKHLLEISYIHDNMQSCDMNLVFLPAPLKGRFHISFNKVL